MDGELDPVFCRDAELDRMVEILCRRQKNNPCLVGEPGVGKTALAEGLAQRIASRNVPRMLQGRRPLDFHLAAVFCMYFTTENTTGYRQLPSLSGHIRFKFTAVDRSFALSGRDGRLLDSGRTGGL